MAKANDDYVNFVIAHYGMLLSVEDLARLFNYPNAEAVRKAHRAGSLPVKLKEFPKRRGLFVTAIEAAEAFRVFDRQKANKEETACVSGN